MALQHFSRPASLFRGLHRFAMEVMAGDVGSVVTDCPPRPPRRPAGGGGARGEDLDQAGSRGPPLPRHPGPGRVAPGGRPAGPGDCEAVTADRQSNEL